MITWLLLLAFFGNSSSQIAKQLLDSDVASSVPDIRSAGESGAIQQRSRRIVEDLSNHMSPSTVNPDELAYILPGETPESSHMPVLSDLNEVAIEEGMDDDSRTLVHHSKSGVEQPFSSPVDQKPSGLEEGAQDESYCESSKNNCAICLSEFGKDNQQTNLSCAHSFHPDCIERWANRGHNTCPMCRAEVIQTKTRGQDGFNTAPTAVHTPPMTRSTSFIHRTLNLHPERPVGVSPLPPMMI
ncbi:hypothetical protein PTTG_26359 [Puccinia triticina 1-1 BBBD Race 1]|uniref:RING-type domain-containing protein n=1 Tax=Puccinia triticina (isolate 1-1 / race 1 (BBBD)) TaxID=630390 RepID=A0A180GU53_PUCT1|nr:hypothetical protein PTTG_26359 [Puccinia triticina 1-1 BBBD Race 1]